MLHNAPLGSEHVL